MRRIVSIALVAIALFLAACEGTPLDRTNPDVVLTEVRFVEARDTAHARVAVTLENAGNEDAYVVSCSFDVMRGSQIVDHGGMSFPSMAPGEWAVEDDFLLDVASRADFDRLEITVTFSNRHGVYESHEYVR